MSNLKRLKSYFFPVIFLIPPGLLGLSIEVINRYHRGTSTPFLYPSLGLILVSLFFWAKKRWVYFLLIGLTVSYLFFLFRHTLWIESRPISVVYYYSDWALNTTTGRIHLKNPLGSHPPPSGAYISCSFSLRGWKSYLNFQPTLCTAFDSKLRLLMFLHDHMTDEGPLREVHINQYHVDRKSLLGEPLDRSALRVAFALKENSWQPSYQIKAIYQVFEREVSPGKTKIVESFSRNNQGKLKSFTESPLLKFTTRDVYAVYNSGGILVEIPRMRGRSFSFPAKIDIESYRQYNLPKWIKPGNISR